MKKNYQKVKFYQKNHQMKFQKNYLKVKSQAMIPLCHNLHINLILILKKKDFRKNQIRIKRINRNLTKTNNLNCIQ